LNLGDPLAANPALSIYLPLVALVSSLPFKEANIDLCSGKSLSNFSLLDSVC